MAKKKAVKKTRKKAVAPRQKIEITITKKIMGKAPQKKHFVLSDGRKLASVYELIDALHDMEEGTFREHVNEFRNDFANWVNDVFKDKSLAEEMKEIEGRMETQRALMKKMVKELEKLTKKNGK